jgi:hypothetical protein
MTSLARSKSLCLGAGLSGFLFLLGPRSARAENSLSYKYEDYRESDGRMVIKTQNALVEQDFGTDMHLKVEGVIDAIAGATPNGQPAPAGSDQVVLAQLHDRRKAWNADFSRQFPAVKVDLGLANSRESDYTSTGWSVNTLTDFNRKNTTLLAGVAGTSDRVKVYYQTPWARKRGRDAILGVTQLLDPLTSATFNLTWGEASGFLSDQYKLVQKNIQVGPGIFLPFTFGENRPDHRTHLIALAALNHAFTAVQGAVEASYRFFHDNYGIDAHTLELHWEQHLGKTVILQPELRLYGQSAAEFYYYRLDATPIIPTGGVPRTQGPFYSSDYRLSDMSTTFYGLKVIWTPSTRWQLDAALEQYDMRGRDGVTPQSAYPRAAIVTFGAKLSW